MINVSWIYLRKILTIEVLPLFILHKIFFHRASLRKQLSATHTVICFKSPRDKTGIRHLLLQVYPEKWRKVLKLFLKVTSLPFGYFMLDLHPASDDCFRIWSHLTKAEGTTRVHTFDEDINSRSLSNKRKSKHEMKRTTKKRKR